MQTEMEYTSKIAANKERDMKKEKRNNSSETRKKEQAKKTYRPPTKDEMMLFGDVLLNNKNNKEQVSEFDSKNPLETGGQQKYEAQTEIIMKNEKLIED
jgi:23S rRNA maturation mini-RNase III